MLQLLPACALLSHLLHRACTTRPFAITLDQHTQPTFTYIKVECVATGGAERVQCMYHATVLPCPIKLCPALQNGQWALVGQLQEERREIELTATGLKMQLVSEGEGGIN